VYAAFLRQIKGRRFIAGLKYWTVLSCVMVATLMLLYFVPSSYRYAPNFAYSAAAVGMSDRVESTVHKVGCGMLATMHVRGGSIRALQVLRATLLFSVLVLLQVALLRAGLPLTTCGVHHIVVFYVVFVANDLLDCKRSSWRHSGLISHWWCTQSPHSYSMSLSQVICWTASAVVGATLGWSLMAHPAMANNPFALAAVICCFCFVVGSLNRSKNTLVILYTLMTVASVALCQYTTTCCDETGSTMMAVVRGSSVAAASLFAVAFQVSRQRYCLLCQQQPAAAAAAAAG
jgi:hypothetical protein